MAPANKDSKHAHTEERKLFRKRIIKVIPRSHEQPITEFYAVAESDLVEMSLPATGPTSNDELIEVVPYDLRDDVNLVYVTAVKNLVVVNKDGCIPNLSWAVANDERMAYYSVSVMKASLLGKVGLCVSTSKYDDYKDRQRTVLHIVTKGKSKYLFEAVLKRMDRSGILKRDKYHRDYIPTGNTVLHLITKPKHIELFRSLVKIRPDLVRPLANITGRSNYVPLHKAVINKNQEMIDVLLPYTRPISICISNSRGRTILDDALMLNNSKLVKMLVNDTYLLEGLVRRSSNLLHLAAKTSYRIFKTLLEAFVAAGHSLTKTQNGTTFFALMIQLRNNSCIIDLMKHPLFDAKLLTMPDRYGSTPLHWAANEGMYRVCRRLYPTYASAGLLLTKNKAGQTVLAAACRGPWYHSNISYIDYKTVVDILLSDPTIGTELANTDDGAGLSPLALAITNCVDLGACEVLYDRINPTQICRLYTKNRYSVLHLAVNRKATKLIDILLKDKEKSRGLPALTDAKGQTALQLSNRPFHMMQHERLTQLLKGFEQ